VSYEKYERTYLENICIPMETYSNRQKEGTEKETSNIFFITSKISGGGKNAKIIYGPEQEKVP
jgi:hypothetical protein